MSKIKSKIKDLIETKEESCQAMKLKYVVKNRLKILRTECDWTQADLSERTGISRQAVISIEKYKYIPSLELAFHLANAFGVTITDVFKLEKEHEV